MRMHTSTLGNVIGLVNKIMDYFWLSIHKGANLRDTIIISGSPRTGTTWIMEILETLPSYRSIFEPFHKEWFPEVKRLNLSSLHRPYVYYKDNNPVLKEYLRKVFQGHVTTRVLHYIPTPRNIYKRLKVSKIIVKFIRANRLLPWIANNFELRGIYFIIRHPCGTIASQLRTNIAEYYKLPIPTLKNHIKRN